MIQPYKKAPHVTWQWYIPKETLIWVCVNQYGMYCRVSYGAWQLFRLGRSTTELTAPLARFETIPGVNAPKITLMLCVRDFPQTHRILYNNQNGLSNGLLKIFHAKSETNFIQQITQNRLWIMSGAGLPPVSFAEGLARERQAKGDARFP